MENIAKIRFEQLYGILVNACGLCIDKDYPYLAASPAISQFINLIKINL